MKKIIINIFLIFCLSSSVFAVGGELQFKSIVVGIPGFSFGVTITQISNKSFIKNTEGKVVYYPGNFYDNFIGGRGYDAPNWS